MTHHERDPFVGRSGAIYARPDPAGITPIAVNAGVLVEAPPAPQTSCPRRRAPTQFSTCACYPHHGPTPQTSSPRGAAPPRTPKCRHSRLCSRKPRPGFESRGEAIRDLAPPWCIVRSPQPRARPRLSAPRWALRPGTHMDWIVPIHHFPGAAPEVGFPSSRPLALALRTLCCVRRSADAPPLAASRRGRAEHLDVEVADLLAQRVAVEAQQRRGADLVAARRRERRHQ